MSAGYRPAAKLLHWLVAVLLAAQFVVTWLMPDIEPHMAVSPVIMLHFTLGLLVVVLMLVRLVARLQSPPPPPEPGTPGWERVLALGTHRLFYLVLIAVPFLGWIAASAHGLPVQFLGVLPLPALAPDGAEWGHQLGDVHGLVMWTMFGLVALHAAAALFHALIRRDGTLRRMLPDRAR